MIYVVFKELRSLYTKCVMCYSGNLLLTYIIYIVNQLFTKYKAEKNTTCIFLGKSIHYCIIEGCIKIH